MQICSPANFISRWPGSLRPIEFPQPPPALPDDCRQLLTDYGLPRVLTIRCYNDTTLTFSGSVEKLAAIWQRDVGRGNKLADMPDDWNRFWHVADQEYLQGSGWICIEETTGRLVVIDLDLAEPIYTLNSSVRSFYTTLAHFLEWSERSGGTPAATIELRDALRRQTVMPPAELESFWLSIVDATLDGDPIKLVVSLVRDAGASAALASELGVG